MKENSLSGNKRVAQEITNPEPKKKAKDTAASAPKIPSVRQSVNQLPTNRQSVSIKVECLCKS
jgi:hypothetical protein